jgi:hypothetical protein
MPASENKAVRLSHTLFGLYVRNFLPVAWGIFEDLKMNPHSICRIQLPAFFQTRRRRKELLTTETELKAIAAAANSGFNKRPKKGYNAPAAMGMPITL